MQIPSVPPPILTNALPQDIVAKAAPVVQVTAPLLANAVVAPPKSEKPNHNRGNKDKDKSRGEPQNPPEDGDSDEQRGTNINIRV